MLSGHCSSTVAMSARRIRVPSIADTTSMPSNSEASYFRLYERIRISSWSVSTDPEEMFRFELRTAAAMSPIVSR